MFGYNRMTKFEWLKPNGYNRLAIRWNVIFAVYRFCRLSLAWIYLNYLISKSAVVKGEFPIWIILRATSAEMCESHSVGILKFNWIQLEILISSAGAGRVLSRGDHAVEGTAIGGTAGSSNAKHGSSSTISIGRSILSLNSAEFSLGF